MVTIGQAYHHIFGVIAADIYNNRDERVNKQRFRDMHGELLLAYDRFSENISTHVWKRVDELALFCLLADQGLSYLTENECENWVKESFCTEKVFILAKRVLAHYR